MIIYVATYPRCGSAVLRRLIHLNFGYVTANGYADTLQGESTAHPLIFTYKSKPYVREPALTTLTLEARSELAALPHLFFVKTHEPPYDNYFPGEKAVQLVRHPGAAIASHYLLDKATAQASPSLDAFIRGEAYGGNWAAYHESWLSASLPKLIMRYEDVYGRQEGLIRTLSEFLSLPIEKVITETPSEASARNPERNPGRGIDGWRDVISDTDDLWAFNGEVAERFGYVKETASERNVSNIATMVSSATKALGLER